MKTKTLTAAAVILAALPALGWAQQAQPMRPQMPAFDFAAADTDASGGISSEEWTAYTRTLRDGMRAQMLGARADALIAAADANGDGSLTRDEIIAGYTALGAQRAEMRGQMDEGRGPGMMRGEGRGARGDDCERGERGDRGHRHGDHERGGMRGHDDHGRGGHDRGGRDMGMQGMQMDPAQRAAQSFDRIDLNGDGQIDADELNLAQQVMQHRMQRVGQGQGQGQGRGMGPGAGQGPVNN